MSVMIGFLIYMFYVMIIIVIYCQNCKTLLHCASESDEVEMLEFWIRRGDYDVNVKDKVIHVELFVTLCCIIEEENSIV